MASPETGDDYEEQIQRLVQRYETELRKRLKRGIRPLHEIEREADEIGDAVKESITQDVVDELGSGYHGSRSVCSCGVRARYVGLRERTIITLHNVVMLRRAYYHCSACRAGFCPLDWELGLSSSGVSRLVQELIARFCSYLPFELATDELKALRGIDVSSTTVQTYAKQVGERIGREWDDLLAQLKCGEAPASGYRPKRLFESMDGVKVHIGGGWHDVKLGVAYLRGGPDNRVTHAVYQGSTDDSRAFGPKMLAIGHRLGVDCCSDIELVADGADWIWQETGKYQPGCVQVLDFYHLCQHLWGAADAWFGPETNEGRHWIKLQKERLLNDEADAVIAEVVGWQPRKKASKVVKRRLVAYLQMHRHRINYKTLRAQGYDIGSGIIEASCKTVVKSRLTRAGMRWEQRGASAILNLSAHWRTTLNGGFFQYTK